MVGTTTRTDAFTDHRILAVRVVVVSPHLDDAAFSIGATLRSLADQRAEVRVVTVFAGDPERLTPPSYWDAGREVETASAATLLRREEDLAASEVLGYEPVWLSFDDDGYVFYRDPDRIVKALEPHLADASIVLIPGWPLVHMDHRYTALMFTERLNEKPIMLYSELPYAAAPRNVAKALLRGRTPAVLRPVVGNDVVWRSSVTSPADRSAKRRAIDCYRGEVLALGYRARMSAAYERMMGREMLGHSPSVAVPSEFRFR